MNLCKGHFFHEIVFKFYLKVFMKEIRNFLLEKC